jgi:hypothetical protein
MQTNLLSQIRARTAWNGAVSTPIDLASHHEFGLTFEVMSNLTADAVFEFDTLPNDPSNHCGYLLTPATPVDLVPMCSNGGATGPARLTIPAGSLMGHTCDVVFPCKPARWLKVRHVSGGATVNALSAQFGHQR